MKITRRMVFENQALQIGYFEARPVSDACVELEPQNSNGLVLPFSGVFSRHDAPGRYVIGTPSHAVLFAANTPYRVGFPGAIGDRALTIRFDEDLVPEQLDVSRKAEGIASHGLLSAKAMMLRICSAAGFKELQPTRSRSKQWRSISCTCPSSRCVEKLCLLGSPHWRGGYARLSA